MRRRAHLLEQCLSSRLDLNPRRNRASKIHEDWRTIIRNHDVPGFHIPMGERERFRLAAAAQRGAATTMHLQIRRVAVHQSTLFLPARTSAFLTGELVGEGNRARVMIRVPSLLVPVGLREPFVILVIRMVFGLREVTRLVLSRKPTRVPRGSLCVLTGLRTDWGSIIVHGADSFACAFEEPDHLFFGEMSAVN